MNTSNLIPAIIQDADTRTALMLGYMNAAAIAQTKQTGKVTFWSRSKQRLWTKGETSGNYLNLVSLSYDCDQDALLIQARPQGPTCHTGSQSCFGNISADFGFAELFKLIEDRKQQMPEGSYTASLFKAGKEAILAKVIEESDEVVQAARGEGKQRLIEESCDLLYHLVVLLVGEGVGLEEVEGELYKRTQ